MLILRPSIPDDIDHLVGWAETLPAIVQWAGAQLFRHPLTRDQFASYLALADGPVATSVILTGIDEGSGVPVAHGEIGMINREQETASLCRILIDPAQRGRGWGRSLVQGLLVRGFNEMKLRRIDLRVYAHNEPAIRCYTSAGFIREGILRQATRVEGVLWDVVLMAHFREEWNRINGQFGGVQ
jgi:RimJ/RimL family protein N-acetyltransferase